MPADNLAELKSRLAKLKRAITDHDTWKYLLETSEIRLLAVEESGERGPVTDFALSLIAEQIRQAETAVAKHGPDLRITGSKRKRPRPGRK